ncbi:hypothetical protein M378DRAFT_156446 [Amanita muscaria Koide BX008]|uniref:Uncharacterized protein n=1 Tax=Amanita muscaria (strain Koide BX008) TaxID=946122 RepID=A0A0C2TSR2_AMAMK|nr:hypothetical protein M378DRAFT_156446 [Amanita muscaria Koide BX008]
MDRTHWDPFRREIVALGSPKGGIIGENNTRASKIAKRYTARRRMVERWDRVKTNTVPTLDVATKPVSSSRTLTYLSL